MDNSDLYKVWYVIMRALEYGPLKKDILHFKFRPDPARHHFGILGEQKSMIWDGAKIH